MQSDSATSNVFVQVSFIDGSCFVMYPSNSYNRCVVGLLAHISITYAGWEVTCGKC